jgi:hypothetical protein
MKKRCPKEGMHLNWGPNKDSMVEHFDGDSTIIKYLAEPNEKLSIVYFAFLYIFPFFPFS